MTIAKQIDELYHILRENGINDELFHNKLKSLFESVDSNNTSNLSLKKVKLLMIAIDNDLSDHVLHKLIEIYDLINLESVFMELFSIPEHHQLINDLITKLTLSKHKNQTEYLLNTLDNHLVTNRLKLSVIPDQNLLILLYQLIRWITSDEILFADISSRILVNITRINKSTDHVVDILFGLLAMKCRTTNDSFILHSISLILSFNSSIHSFINQIIDNSIILFRFYAVFSDIMTVSDEFFDKCLSYGFVDTLRQFQESNDLLGLTVIIDYYSKFSLTLHGCNYVLSSGLLEWLIQVASIDETSGDFFGTLAPQAIRIFTTIYVKLFQTYTSTCESTSHIALWETLKTSLFPKFLSVTKNLLTSRSVTNRIVGSQILSQFTSSSIECLKLIVGTSDSMSVFMDLANLSYCGNVEIQLTVLQSYSVILDAYAAIARDQREIGATIRRVYTTLSRSSCNQDFETTSYLLKLCKQPIPEVKHAALNVLISVGKYDWSIQSFLITIGFIEYLQITEYTKDGRELKYNLIKTILANPEIRLVTDDIVSMLQILERRGPHVPISTVDLMEP